jgi:hypothetical protein
MDNFELKPEVRKMLFEMAKHLSTLNVAAILLLFALLDKFNAGAINGGVSVKWTFFWFGFSLLVSVCSMFCLVGLELQRKQHIREIVFVGLGHIAGFMSFFFGILNVMFMSWQALK